MIEGPVFLHQKNDVFGVKVGGAELGVDRKCSLYGIGNNSGKAERTCKNGCFFKKVSSVFHCNISDQGV